MWQTGKNLFPKLEYSRLKQTRKQPYDDPTIYTSANRKVAIETGTQDNLFFLAGRDLALGGDSGELGGGKGSCSRPPPEAKL